MRMLKYDKEANTKKIREQVYQKYNGHCAYCGCELDYKDMQVDHVKSVYGNGDNNIEEHKKKIKFYFEKEK